jgi:MFS family permease
MTFIRLLAARLHAFMARLHARFAPQAPHDNATTPEGRRRAMLLLFLCLMANGLGQTMVFAILPTIARDLRLAEWQAGSIFALSAAIWVYSSPYWGKQSDKYGRRQYILIGLVGYGASMLGLATVFELGLAGWIPLVLVWPLAVATRSLHGIFGAAAFPAAQAYIADRTSPQERTEAVATLSASFGMGAAIGPGLGAALVFLGVLAPLYFVGALAMASAIAIWFLLPERTKPVEREGMPHPELSWRDPRVLPFVIFGLALGTAGAIPVQIIGFYILDTLRAQPADSQQLTGVALMASSIASLFAQFVLVQRFKLTSGFLIHAGVLIALLSNLILVFHPNYGLIVFALLLSGLGFGMARPGYGAASSLAVTPDEQGAVAGIMGGASAAGFVFAPVLGGWLYGFNPTAPFILCVILMAGLYIYVLANPRLRMIEKMPDHPDDTSGIPKS